MSFGGGGKVIDKVAGHCHVHLEPEKTIQFSFIEVGFGDEVECKLNKAARQNCLAALFVNFNRNRWLSGRNPNVNEGAEEACKAELTSSAKQASKVETYTLPYRQVSASC